MARVPLTAQHRCCSLLPSLGMRWSKDIQERLLSLMRLQNALSMETDMNKCLIAFTAALCFAGSTSSVVAQYPAQGSPQNLEQGGQAKDAATSQCITTAQAQYPQDSVADQTGRTVTYKACMNAAGFQQ
jgi:hypothetical protein